MSIFLCCYVITNPMRVEVESIHTFCVCLYRVRQSTMLLGYCLYCHEFAVLFSGTVRTSCIHALIHSYAHTLIHSYTHTFVHSYTRTMHSYTHTLTHRLTHSYTHIHSYTHTLTHSYTHTLHSCKLMKCSNEFDLPFLTSFSLPLLHLHTLIYSHTLTPSDTQRWWN